MAKDKYKIKIKEGNIEIAISGDEKFVKRAFKQLKEVLNQKYKGVKKPRVKKPGKRRKKPGRKKKPGPKPKKKVKPKKIPKKDRVDMTKMTLKEIFKMKAPKRENQRVLLLAYYMNKVEGKREFRAMDLPKLYKKLKLGVPKNLSYFLRKMSEDQKALRTHGKKQGRYKITDKGIDFIYNKIPNT